MFTSPGKTTSYALKYFMHFFISQDNPTERIPGQLTKQQEAEKTVDQVPAEKKFLNISYFDLKMIVIASAAMVFSIICGKTAYMKANFLVKIMQQFSHNL